MFINKKLVDSSMYKMVSRQIKIKEEEEITIEKREQARMATMSTKESRIMMIKKIGQKIKKDLRINRLCLIKNSFQVCNDL